MCDPRLGEGGWGGSPRSCAGGGGRFLLCPPPWRAPRWCFLVWHLISYKWEGEKWGKSRALSPKILAPHPGTSVLTVSPCLLSPQIEADFRANGECGRGAPLASPRTDMASQRLSPGSSLTGPIVPIEPPKTAPSLWLRPTSAPASPRRGSGGPRSDPIASAGVSFGPRFLPGKSPCRRSGLSLCAIFFFSLLCEPFSPRLLPSCRQRAFHRGTGLRSPAPAPANGGESEGFG